MGRLYFMDLDAKIMAGTAPEVPIADGPNHDRFSTVGPPPAVNAERSDHVLS